MPAVFYEIVSFLSE